MLKQNMTAAAQNESPESLESLNCSLRAIRSINRLITQSHDHEAMLQGICACLTETCGYDHTWIALLDDDHNLGALYASGLGEALVPLTERLQAGSLPQDCSTALESDNLVISEYASEDALASSNTEGGAMTIRLAHEDCVFGVICASVSQEQLHDEQARTRMTDVAQAVSFALYALDLKEKRGRYQQSLEDAEVAGRFGTCEIDIASGVTTVSAHWADILGVEKQTLTLDEIRALVHPDDQDVARTAFQHAADGTQPFDLSIRVIRPNDKRQVMVHAQGTLQIDANGKPVKITGIAADVTKEDTQKSFQKLSTEALAILNRDAPLKDRLGKVLTRLQECTGCEAVGIRLQEGGDFPYFMQNGFSSDFMLKENSLVARDANGGICRQPDGTVCLECTCGLVISGKTDPTSPLFTPAGSCWMNDSFPLLELHPSEDPRLKPRNECIHDGYASVALIPIKSHARIVGILQLNAKAKNCFTLRMIEWLEDIAAQIGSALLRAKSEEMLRESQQRLLLATRAAGLGIWDWDITTNSMTWDEQMFQLYGIGEPPQHYGAELWEAALHPDDKEYALAETQAAVRGEKEFNIEYRICWPDGTVRYLEADGLVIRDDAGKAVRMLGTNYDITMQKKAERELKALERRSRALLDYSPVCHKIIDRDLNLQYMNANGFRMLNLEESNDLFGKPYPFDFFPEASRQLLTAKLRSVLETGEKAELEDMACDSAGHEVWLAHALIPVPDEEGAINFITVVSADITEKKRTQERIRQMEKMDAIGQLAGGVAHDFNNQLAAIMGYSDMLRGQLTEPKSAKYIEYILLAARRSADLTKQLLAFSRKTEQVYRPTDVHTVILEVVAMLQHSIDKRISIHQHLDAPKRTILADASQIQNVLLNISINARDAMPDGGEILIETKNIAMSIADCKQYPSEIQPGNYVQIRIQDSGCGMSEQVKARLFEPFFTTKDVGKGTGMGLAAAYGAVRQHRGGIRVYSEVGHGSAFSLLFPLATQEESTQCGNDTDATSLKKMQVLIIDDEELLRCMACDMLELVGVQAHAEEDGQAGVDYYADHWRDIDIIILDIVMPRLTGRDAFQAIRRINPHAKVVISSGFSAGQDVKLLLEQGASGFLPKPFQQEDLVRALLQATDHS